jgi:hypothetical protein
MGGCFYFRGLNMHFCFMDESGDSSTLTAFDDAKQAALIVAGLFVDARLLPALTADFIALKKQFFPEMFKAPTKNAFDALLVEIKGSDHITAVVRKKGANSRGGLRALLFLDGVLDLCIRHQTKLVGRAWVKELNVPMHDKSVYTITAQTIAERFQEYLHTANSDGMIVADHRDPKRNSYVAHSVFTQMHKKSGSKYPRLQETVVFGISDNHAGLQITDLLTSAALLPLVSTSYLMGRFRNAHTHPSMHIVAKRVTRKIKNLEFNYQHPKGYCRGLTVADPRDKKAKFFPVPAPAKADTPAPVALPAAGVNGAIHVPSDLSPPNSA